MTHINLNGGAIDEGRQAKADGLPYSACPYKPLYIDSFINSYGDNEAAAVWLRRSWFSGFNAKQN